jgi:hypothetical protein
VTFFAIKSDLGVGDAPGAAVSHFTVLKSSIAAPGASRVPLSLLSGAASVAAVAQVVACCSMICHRSTLATISGLRNIGTEIWR